MIITVGEYVMETEYMSPSVSLSLPAADHINVWLKFIESNGLPVHSFGIKIAPVDYNDTNELADAIRRAARDEIEALVKQQQTEEEKRRLQKQRKSDLNLVGERLAMMAGTDWYSKE